MAKVEQSKPFRAGRIIGGNPSMEELRMAVRELGWVLPSDSKY